jgi:hypothetical protein
LVDERHQAEADRELERIDGERPLGRVGDRGVGLLGGALGLVLAQAWKDRVPPIHV